MTASELYSSGKLQEAIEAQTQVVRGNPADPAVRLFLFELLVFAGDLDRARRQIEAVNFGTVGQDFAVLTYRLLLEAETARRRLFCEGALPHLLGPASAHLQFRLEAVHCLRANQQGKAASLLTQAAAAAPAVTGELNSKPYASLRDTDEVFGPVLEIMDRGRYCWLPLDGVQSLTAEAPRYPRDLLWMPACLEMQGGQTRDVHVPVLYPGSHAESDDRVKLGRITQWAGADDGPTRGLGARVFEVDSDEVCLLEWRQLTVRCENRSPAVS